MVTKPPSFKQSNTHRFRFLPGQSPEQLGLGSNVWAWLVGKTSPELQALSSRIQEAPPRLTTPGRALSLAAACLRSADMADSIWVEILSLCLPTHLILTLSYLQSAFPCVISFAAHKITGGEGQDGALPCSQEP